MHMFFNNRGHFKWTLMFPEVPKVHQKIAFCRRFISAPKSQKGVAAVQRVRLYIKYLCGGVRRVCVCSGKAAGRAVANDI
jgi:hypothetical protein